MILGSAEGVADGFVVGPKDGAYDGVWLGILLGDNEGNVDGDSVGVLLGNKFGSQSTELYVMFMPSVKLASALSTLSIKGSVILSMSNVTGLSPNGSLMAETIFSFICSNKSMSAAETSHTFMA